MYGACMYRVPKQQLTRMKRPTGRVANLPVGLHDAVLHIGVRAVETGLHLLADLMENLGEQSLVVLGKGQGVAVAGEPLHEILGQVGSAHHAQLAEKGQAAVVQAEHRLRPHLARRAAGGVGLHCLGFQLLSLRQQLRLFAPPADPGIWASCRRSTLRRGCTGDCRCVDPDAPRRTGGSGPLQTREGYSGPDKRRLAIGLGRWSWWSGWSRRFSRWAG